MVKKEPYKAIPIAAAREIAKSYDKDQVIIVAWDKAHGKEHVTTYGKTTDDCSQAAQGGNMVKKAMGWPEALCNAQPSREKQLQKKVKLLEEQVKNLEKQIYEMANRPPGGYSEG